MNEHNKPSERCDISINPLINSEFTNDLHKLLFIQSFTAFSKAKKSVTGELLTKETPFHPI
jgi:hypothetical protein